MESESKPSLGSTQPKLGRGLPLRFEPVAQKRTSKSSRPPAIIRGIVARNLVVLRDSVLKHLPHATDRNRELAARTGLSLSQVQRIAAGTLGTSIDHIELLADALGVRAMDLMTPYFWMQLKNKTGEAPSTSAQFAESGADDSGELQRPHG